MKHDYTFYGWQASYFAGKTRAYLNYKGVDYVNKEINRRAHGASKYTIK